MNIDPKNILNISFSDNLNLNIEIGFIVVVIGIILLIVFVIKFFKNLKWGYSTELHIKLGGIGVVKIKPNTEVSQIAHKAWAELITRKAGLCFDEKDDVIIEVYDSWYTLFKEIRDLIKDVPSCQIKNKQTKILLDVLVESLNKGLRPHLTKWQSKFRRWYNFEAAKPENEKKSPQEIQKLYPFYKDLSDDLIQINEQLVAYTQEIKKLTF